MPEAGAAKTHSYSGNPNACMQSWVHGVVEGVLMGRQLSCPLPG